MSGSSIITLLMVLFTFVTFAGVVAAIHRFRRLPIVAMIAAAERRARFHDDAIAALEAAIVAEQAAGKDTTALAASLAGHRRAARNLAAAAPFAARR